MDGGGAGDLLRRGEHLLPGVERVPLEWHVIPGLSGSDPAKFVGVQ